MFHHPRRPLAALAIGILICILFQAPTVPGGTDPVKEKSGPRHTLKAKIAYDHAVLMAAPTKGVTQAKELAPVTGKRILSKATPPKNLAVRLSEESKALFGTAQSNNRRSAALAACTIVNLQGAWAWGYLNFSTPGGIFKVYFDPGATGGVSDPGCGQGPSVYPFRIDNLQIPGFATAAAFGYPGEEAGILEYTFDIECTNLPADPCAGPGTQLWESALQFLSIPVGGPTIVPIGIASPGICASAPFFMGLRYQSWTGASNRVPSPLWDGDATDPPCRGWLSNDGGATWTDQEVFFGGDLGWCDYVVTGNTLDPCTPQTCPIIEGYACCFGGPDYDCLDLLPPDCTAAGGTPSGTFNFCAYACCPAPPPPNDLCTGAVVHSVPSGTITGDSQGATADCPLLGDPDPVVWEKFELTECTEVTVSFCNTAPALASMWIVVFDDCDATDGCEAGNMIFADDSDFTTCPDGNPTVYFTLPAGTYYYPINADQCDIYTMEFTGAPCQLATCCYEDPPGTAACQYTDRFTCDQLNGYFHEGSPDMCATGFCDTGVCCVDPSVDPTGCVDGETPAECGAHTPAGTWKGGPLCVDSVCPPLNDDCADAFLVCAGSGSCSTPFTNLGATTDGPADCADASGELGNFHYDVWFDYQAVCDGPVNISLCNTYPYLTYDGMMAAYSTTNCPPGTILGCDDDFCGGADMSQFEVNLLNGDWIKIRVGGWDSGGYEEAAKGNGVLEILSCPVCGNGILEPGESCDDGGLCTGDNATPCTSDLDCQAVGGTCTTRAADCVTDFCEADCTVPDPSCPVCPYCPYDQPCDVTRCHEENGICESGNCPIGMTSDLNPGAGFTVADSFKPTTGTIDQVCWWGIYYDFDGTPLCEGGNPADDFTITYYDDDGGSPSLPLNVLGVRNIPAGDLEKRHTSFVSTSVGDVKQYGYTAPHAPVTVTPNECHWIEIVNNTVGSCFWLWRASGPWTGGNGDGVSAQDLDLNGYTVDELLDHDLAFCVSSTMSPSDCGFRIGACCDDSDGSCQDAVEITNCQPPLRFVDDTLCADLVPTCGSGACCDYTTGGCTVELAANCVGATQNHYPSVDCAEIICDLDDCDYDNGLPDVAGNAPASQYADDADFFAEGSDDFTLLGTGSPECEILTIIASITHWNHNGGCQPGGNPGFCDDDPDDYTSIRVTIYADATPTGPAGMPTQVARACVDDTDCATGDTCGTITPLFCDNTFDNLDGTHTGTVVHELTVLPADYSHVLLGLPEDSQFEVTMDVSGDNVLLNRNTRYWIAVAPEVNFSGFYQSAMMESLNYNGNPAQQIFSSLALTPWQVINVGVDLSFELIGIGGEPWCFGDQHWDPWTNPADRWACDDADCCTHDECVNDLCESTPLATGKYADLDNNGDVNLQDLLCMLDVLGGVCGGSCLTNGSCDNADISPCAGNGDINLMDLFVMLDSLHGQPPVNCP